MRAIGWNLECTTGSSCKYYRIMVAGTHTIFQYGRIGNVQALAVTDHRSTLAAQDAAWKQSAAKERTYQRTVEETVFDVDPAWLPRCQDQFTPESSSLRRAFAQAVGAGAALRGELPGADGPRVVALRRWRAQAAALAGSGVLDAVASALVAHRGLDIALAALPADVLAILDAAYTPRLALTDLGPAESGDTADVLASTLTMFEPSAVDGPGNLAGALLTARLVHA